MWIFQELHKTKPSEYLLLFQMKHWYSEFELRNIEELREKKELFTMRRHSDGST